MESGDARLARFVEGLTTAVGAATSATEVCGAVKAVLTDAIRPGRAFLPASVLRPSGESYARNLLHRDPQGRFCVVVMVWTEGQGTPIHDHGGLWCVECVYRGRIRVRSFSRGENVGELATFEETESVVAGCGEAGHLIPPFDYHIIDNPFDDAVASTVHVYGGDMKRCRVFEPAGEGRYRERQRTLAFAPS